MRTSKLGVYFTITFESPNLMFNLKYLVIFLLYLTTLGSVANTLLPKKDAYNAASQLAKKFYDKNHLTGLSVTVATKNKTIFSINYGYLTTKKKKAVTGDTPFRIASVSKFIAAIVTLKLIQDKTSLHAGLSIYPYIQSIMGNKTPLYLKKVSIDNLLTHTSGIRHYKENRYLEEKQFNGSINSRLDAISVNGAIFDKPQFNPSKGYLYSTYAINLVQDFIEKESGFSYLSYLKKIIIKPLSLHNTGAYNSSTSSLKSKPYILFEKQIKEAPNVNASWKLPGGGLISSTNDLVKIIQSLVSGDLLDHNHYQFLITKNPYHLKDVDYGRGIHVFHKKQNVKLLGHGGWATGGAAYVLFDSDGSLILTAATNLQIPSNKLRKLLMSIYLLIQKA